MIELREREFRIEPTVWVEFQPLPLLPRVRCATPDCGTWLSRYRLSDEQVCEACRLAALAHARRVVHEVPRRSWQPARCSCRREMSAGAKQCAQCARGETRQAWAAYQAGEPQPVH